MSQKINENYFMAEDKITKNFFLDCFILEDANDKLFQNLGKQLPTYATEQLTIVQTSPTPGLRSEILQTTEFIKWILYLSIYYFSCS